MNLFLIIFIIVFNVLNLFLIHDLYKGQIEIWKNLNYLIGMANKHVETLFELSKNKQDKEEKVTK